MDEALADPELRDWLSTLRKQQPDTAEPDLATLRAPQYRPGGPPLWSVPELRIGARPVTSARLYRPGPERLPLVLYAHGSGFVFVDLDSHDRVCRRLALTANAAVLSVDYRLAPEHPAPAAVDDLFNVARWSARLPDQVGPVMPNPALAGDSAGGAIAVLAAARLARASISSSAVLLICPTPTSPCPSPAGAPKPAAGVWRRRRWAGSCSNGLRTSARIRCLDIALCTRICAACQRLWLPPPSTIPCTTKASRWWIIYAPWRSTHATCPTPAWSMAS